MSEKYTKSSPIKRLQIYNGIDLYSNFTDTNKVDYTEDEWIEDNITHNIYDENGESIYSIKKLKKVDGESYDFYDPVLPPDGKYVSPDIGNVCIADKIHKDFVDDNGKIDCKGKRGWLHSHGYRSGVDYLDNSGGITCPHCYDAYILSFLSLRGISSSSRLYQWIDVLRDLKTPINSYLSGSEVISKIIKVMKDTGRTNYVYGRCYETIIEMVCNTGKFSKNISGIASKFNANVSFFSMPTLTLKNNTPAEHIHKEYTVEYGSKYYIHNVTDVTSTGTPYGKHFRHAIYEMFKRSNINYDPDKPNNLCKTVRSQYNTGDSIYLPGMADYVSIHKSASSYTAAALSSINNNISLDTTDFKVLDEDHIQIPDDAYGLYYITLNATLSKGCISHTKKLPECTFNICKNSDGPKVIMVVMPGKLPGVDKDTQVESLWYEKDGVTVKNTTTNKTYASGKDLWYSDHSRSTAITKTVDGECSTDDDLSISGDFQYDYNIPGKTYHVTETFTSSGSAKPRKICGGNDSNIKVILIKTSISVRAIGYR